MADSVAPVTDLAPLFENNRAWAADQLARDPDFFEKLAKRQSPEYLWIGCSDSRVPANQIVGLFGTLGLELAVKDISNTEWARTNAPNSYELWFTGTPMPKICQQAAAG